MKISKLVENENRTQVAISVRDLVEFLLSEGDIDESRPSRMRNDAMAAGSRMHRKLQKAAGSFYHPEVFLKTSISYEDYDFAIEGRADGIIYDDDMEKSDVPCIDEIKGMYADVLKFEEAIPVHIAQAKVYAYIFASQMHLKQIAIQMTYVNLDTEEIKKFREEFDFSEIEEWFLSLVEAYKPWSDYLYYHRKERQESIQGLQFPYAYRPGQKKLVSDVYLSLMREKILFLQAPTGTGKTLATIFPAVWAMGQGNGEKIFYLTAKNAAGVVARETFDLLHQKGYQGKTVCLMAKDKMCPLEERSCNPTDCPYAAGHFDRVRDAVYAILGQETMIDRDKIFAYAKEYQVCPFEFSLDIASWMDHIICDYNYVFDPNVCLKRFFAEGIRGDYLFLVDEAHNLVDRAREMYSETLIKEEFLSMKKILKPFGKKVENALERCNKDLLVYKRQCDKMLLVEQMDAFLFALLRLASEMEKILQGDVKIENRDQVLEFYFKVRNFISLSDYLDEHYRIYCDFNEEGQFCLHLFCADPSYMLQMRLDRARACVFFSATLLPIQYYKELLCNKTDVYAVYANPVFDPAKRLLLVGDDVTSKYTRRGIEEYRRYANYIAKIVSAKKGNYMVFCPSYRVLTDVSQQFMAINLNKADIIFQNNHMTEIEREAFLEEFEKEREKSLVAFCVMGGVFSEGIDLKGDRLIGSILVGVGLPQIGNEREVIRGYFEDTNRNGFLFSYLYPGMNKVIQAAGRVIRTDQDCGVIALLDERFLLRDYAACFPREWSDYKRGNLSSVSTLLDEFWENV